MTKRLHWQDAQDALAWLKAGPGDRRTLLLITTLPFVNASILAQLVGLQGGASVYRSLERLRQAGLVTAIKPALYAEPPCRLYCPTDLALATVALETPPQPALPPRPWPPPGPALTALTPRPRASAASRPCSASVSGRSATSSARTSTSASWARPATRSSVAPSRGDPWTRCACAARASTSSSFGLQ